uniref:Solute carrier family 25 member 36a n=1 Tax=Takifugu rubripes TaxID=31033 RepID=A0A674PGX1_TAKRU
MFIIGEIRPQSVTLNSDVSQILNGVGNLLFKSRSKHPLVDAATRRKGFCFVQTPNVLQGRNYQPRSPHSGGRRYLLPLTEQYLHILSCHRAIYFAAYSKAKEKLNGVLEPDSTQVHMLSAGMAGFTAITATNPIWLIKTRLQLETRSRGERRMNAIECVGRVYRMDGLRGFYRGMSASYAGISETVIHFVIYESIKRKLSEFKANSSMDEEEESVKNASDFVGMMLAAATSKTCATSIAYPHEVIRTRLREEGSRYRSFFQTLLTVPREEGYGALYRGLTTHLVRQIPNTAIMMCTYEVVVYLLGR